VQREPSESAVDPKCLHRPAVWRRGGFHAAQHGADVNGLAVVAAVIFAESLHAENFAQRRADANEIYRLAGRLGSSHRRINAHSIARFGVCAHRCIPSAARN
jgi:hypothetical protein